jgi:hypothetical protein
MDSDRDLVDSPALSLRAGIRHRPGQISSAVIAGETLIQVPVAAQGEVTPRPTIAPFRFILPTPGAEPVSGWRPPLYPVPWAVSAYDHFYFARPIAADNVNWPLAEYRYGAFLLGQRTSILAWILTLSRYDPGGGSRFWFS